MQNRMQGLVWIGLMLISSTFCTEDCCVRKSVGGIDYTLTGTESTDAFGCTSNCVYRRHSDPPGREVCFKPGPHETVCRGAQPSDCGQMVTRINVLDIPVEDYPKYNRALRLMKKYQNSTSFANISQYHGAPFFCNYNQTGPPGEGNDTNGCCVNHWQQDDRMDLFTPWHRLYVFQMEMSLKTASASFGKPLPMPYWDWTNPNTQNSSHPNALPLLANQGHWTNGPILAWPARNSSENVTRRGPDPNYDFNALRRMTKTSYKQKTFCEFNRHIVAPHNLVHLHVGSCNPSFWKLTLDNQYGNCSKQLFPPKGVGLIVPPKTGHMASNYWSSYDPIFYLHHSYVDQQYAFWQELQKLRNKTNSVKNPSFKMQPFNRKDNPFKASRINSQAGQTEDYTNNFCYKFDKIEFAGKNASQFEEQNKEERKSPSLYAAILLKSTKVTSYLQYDLIGKSKTYQNIASAVTLGAPVETPDYSEPKTNHIMLYEVTDLITDPQTELKDKSMTFNVSKYVDSLGNELDKNEAYKPLTVYREADSDTLVFRYHEDHFHDYSPEIQIRLGSKVEFLTSEGSYSGAVREVLPGGGSRRAVTGQFNIQRKKHTFQVTGTEGKARTLTTGFTLDCLIQCDENGDPQSLDPDLKSISWSRKPAKETQIVLKKDQEAIFAWCRGAPPVNVFSFENEADYNNCKIPQNGTQPWDDEDPDDIQRGFLIDTTNPGKQYFANGVGNNCKNGWKVVIIVK